MFNIFKKKSPIDKLQKEYKKLLEEAFILSKINRQESDKKQAEANAILIEIENLNSSGM